MDAGVSTARQVRSHHRYELRSLTYVTLDQGNGGVVRNLTRDGIGAQMVAAVRPQQQLRVRFELLYPRVWVEARGEVVWATPSGQCGIRFLDLSPRTSQQVQEWIFSDLLEGTAVHSRSAGWMFSGPEAAEEEQSHEDDGLMISPAPPRVIELSARHEEVSDATTQSPLQMEWLSRPLSGRGLSWTVNTLVVFAAALLFVLVFLSVTGEAPRWPLAMTGAAALLVAGMYWGFFQIIGGESFGERLARLAGTDGDEVEESDARFR